MPNETVTVLDVLKEAGKATAQEIAAKLDIDQVDTLVMLQEEMEQGTVACEGGRWSLVNVSNVNISASIDTDVNIDAPPPPVDPNIIFRALQQNGAMTAATLANFVNRTPRGMASVMSGMARRGLVVKNGQGEGCTWSLPSTNASASVNAGSGTSVGGTSEDVGAKVPASPVLIDATSNPQKASVQEMTTTAGYDAGAGESIPAFPDTDADADDFVFRLLTRGNQERQRVRECAARLDEVCDALSVLHKYPDLIHQLSKGEKK
ncbi:DUF1627 domain-containing protein [Salmonella enterica]|nr:DUF1627 domain-containing protein [Salmonella enterica]EBD7599820.1 DUF1627 domain-containing protein [Salmonella enterica]EHF8057662.1 DUF1627 domain-containing protein [Salmonella enterica subsp. enterica serovar Oranienburg]ELE1936522.1 DUF1627 domain-containing protein [Salmonella enterica]